MLMCVNYYELGMYGLTLLGSLLISLDRRINLCLHFLPHLINICLSLSDNANKIYW